jgi:hypothetical protein
MPTKMVVNKFVTTDMAKLRVNSNGIVSGKAIPRLILMRASHITKRTGEQAKSSVD